MKIGLVSEGKYIYIEPEGLGVFPFKMMWGACISQTYQQL